MLPYAEAEEASEDEAVMELEVMLEATVEALVHHEEEVIEGVFAEEDVDLLLIKAATSIWLSNKSCTGHY